MARRYGALRPTQDVDADGESDAVARVIQAFVGSAAWLFEMVAGHSVSDDMQVTPPNPQGEIGIDYSGPPWGSAIKHPIALTGGKQPDESVAFGMTVALKVPPGETRTIGPWRVWVRPFEQLPAPYVAPYALGSIRAMLFSEVSQFANVTLGVRNLSITSSPMVNTFFVNATFDEDSTVAGSSRTIALIPGWNDLEMRFAHDGDEDLSIAAISINQEVKRSH